RWPLPWSAPVPGAAAPQTTGRIRIFQAPRTCVSRCAREGRTPSPRRHAQPFISVPKSDAAPRPFLRRARQLRLRRIPLDVAPRSRLMFSSAHIGIPISILPELSFAPQNLICLLGGVALPRSQQLPHWHVLYQEEHMHMIRHYHPGSQLVLHFVPKQQRILYYRRNISTLQMTLASPFVQVRLQFDAPLSVIFDFQQPLPFGTQLRRKGVRQPERDKLDETRLISMWQITILMPPEKPAVNLLLRQWTRPRSLTLYKVAHARIVGRAGQSLALHREKGKCKPAVLTSPECPSPSAASHEPRAA